MSPSVRRPENEELRDCAALALATGLGGSWALVDFQAVFSDPNGRILVVAEPKGRLAGFVLARRIADLIEIDLVAVADSQRRRGLGRALLDGLLAAEATTGIVEAQLELRPSNAPAKALYSSLGFVVVGRRPRYYPDGEDALLWSRRFEKGPD